MAAYTEALADEICRLTVDSSFGLRHICRQLRQPYSTVNDWIYKNLHGFADNYARAKQLQSNRILDEILEIADDDSNDRPQDAFARAKLRIEARKWLYTIRAAEESGNERDEPKHRRVNLIIKPAPPAPHPLENTTSPGPQYDQPIATPAMQAQTSPSPDAILNDKSTHEGQENTGGSSPKNTPFTRHSNSEGGETRAGRDLVCFAISPKSQAWRAVLRTVAPISPKNLPKQKK